jgi:hypothetical protein
MKMKNLPCDERINPVCPMTLPREDGPYACCEGQCAWWSELGHGCIIVSISSSLWQLWNK